MGYDRTHSFQKKKSLTPQPRTQLGTRPFAAPIQRKPDQPKTPDELENEAFNHNKFEAFGLQLKEKNGTITPVEQERLGVLQAKMDDFWVQRRERASQMSNDLSKIPVHPPEGYPTPQLQPMGLQRKDGVAREDDTEERNSPQQMSRLPIQAKLTIGEAGDKYEQEADAVAARVVEQIHAPATAQPTQGQSVQRKDEEETEEVQAKPEISALQRMDEPNEEEIQGKFIQKAGEANAGGEATTDLESAINSARGGGQPLDAGLQQSMGQAMGADFSGVRVHTNAQADELNQSIQAKAFTTGQDVFFRQGEYQPGSPAGQELIAHELTHVVQQNGGDIKTNSCVMETALGVHERAESREPAIQCVKEIGPSTEVFVETAGSIHIHCTYDTDYPEEEHITFTDTFEPGQRKWQMVAVYNRQTGWKAPRDALGAQQKLRRHAVDEWIQSNWKNYQDLAMDHYNKMSPPTTSQAAPPSQPTQHPPTMSEFPKLGSPVPSSKKKK